MQASKNTKKAVDRSTEVFVGKRGRPSLDQAAAITAHILEVATAHLLADGFARTSMDAVAIKAGVSKTTLYGRFPSKADLFRAVVTDRAQKWPRLTPEEKLDHSQGISERLSLRASILFEALRDKEVNAFRRLVISESAQFPELLQDMMRHGHDQLVEEIADDIRTAADRRGVQAVDPEGVAVTFVSALLGWWQREAIVKDVAREESEAFASRLVALLTGGDAAW